MAPMLRIGAIFKTSISSIYSKGMRLIVRVIVTMFSLVLVAKLLPGIEIVGASSAFFAALLLGVLNALVRPILIVLTLPVTVLSLGLFIFIINAVLFLAVASWVDGFHVDGFLPALFGSVLVSMVSSVVHRFV